MQLASLSNHDDDEGNDPNKTRQKFNEENKNFEQTNVLNIIINWFLTDLCFIKSDRCDFDLPEIPIKRLSILIFRSRNILDCVNTL